MCGAHGGHKRAPDTRELELQEVCEPPCGFWEVNMGPLSHLSSLGLIF